MKIQLEVRKKVINNLLIFTLCTKYIGKEKVQPSVQLWDQLRFKYDPGRIRCILFKKGKLDGADISKCEEAMISFLREMPLDLNPEIDLYIGGDFPKETVSVFERMAEAAWNRFFRGYREKIVYHSKERFFIRVQAKVPKVVQLIGNKEINTL